MNDGVSIIVAVILILIAMRWMLGGSQPTNQSSGQRRPIARRQHRVTPQMVEMVLAMFPDIPQPAIIADLQRTGAVEATVDNALRNGGLPMPANHSSSPAPGSSAATSARKSPVHTNLIQRYNLDAKQTEEESLAEPPKVWEVSADKRQEMLRKRKEFMVLQARKKLADEQKRREEEKKAALCAETATVPELSKETGVPNYEDMSVDELNNLGPEQKRQHMLEALERRKMASGESTV